jgi:hypothetical protein
MKTFVAIVLLLGIAVTAALAQTEHRVYRDRDGNSYVYLKVTGSLIPQKVKVTPFSGIVDSTSPLTIWDRERINATGRFTLEGVLAQDPSIQIRGR